MGNRILVLASPNDKHLGLFSDLEKSEKSILHYVEFKKVGKLKRLIRRIVLSRRIWRFRPRKPIPFQYLWYDYGKSIPLDEVRKILVVNGCVDKINFKFLRHCKQKGISIILLIIDSIESESLTVLRNRSLYFSSVWNTVYSFDPIDAKKYGFCYRGLCYYSKNKDYMSNDLPIYDVYFTGGVKGGRLNLINNTYKYLTSLGCKCAYDVMLQNIKDERCEGINYVTKWINYKEVLSKISQSKCILELLQNNQHGSSLRFFEAVFYNKKLLTNNPSIKDYPYYDPRWMRIINSPEEIDIEWVKSTERVDYKYKGDFSPIFFIEHLLKTV